MIKKNGSIREGIVNIINQAMPVRIDESDSFEKRLTQPLSYKYTWALKKISAHRLKHNITRKELKVLELGCGTGMLTYLMNKLDYDVEVVDVDESSLSLLKKHTPDVKVYNNHILDIPIQECKYDVIVGLQVLEHIKRDKETIVALNKMLKPNGLMLITVPIGRNLFSKEHVNFYDFYNLVDLFNTIGSNFGICRMRKFFKEDDSPKNLFGVMFFKDKEKDKGEKDE